jgi:hypothetical protein
MSGLLLGMVLSVCICWSTVLLPYLLDLFLLILLLLLLLLLLMQLRAGLDTVVKGNISPTEGL